MLSSDPTNEPLPEAQPGQPAAEAGSENELRDAEGAGATMSSAPAGGATAEDRPATPAGADAGTDAGDVGDAGDVADEAAPRRPRVGSVVDGVVTSVAVDHLLVDVGAKADGVVPLAEIALPEGRTLDDEFRRGLTLQVAVVGYDPDGAPRLSQSRAAEAAEWRRLEAAHRNGETITATVREPVRGGLLLDAGVRAFMPASHVERTHVDDLAQYAGREMTCRILEIDRGRGKLIVSHKAVLDDERGRRREVLWAEIAEGQVREGVVKGLTDFGAFVDLGGADGLLHISAMSWGRIRHPSELVSVGQKLSVQVLKLDREAQRISLGLKQLDGDPWAAAEERFPVGAVVDGRVTRLVPYGAFVELEPGVDGLVHVSQMAEYRVRDPREIVAEGQSVRCKVLRVAPSERRISLSLRDVDPVPVANQQTAAATDTGGATIGDVLGGMRNLFGGDPAPGS